MPRDSKDPIPKINPYVLNGFQWYIPRYLRKHFHSLSQNRSELAAADISPNDSMVAYANHGSWWDPLVAMYSTRTIFNGFDFYAPIDAVALQKYRIFSQLGFFPVEQDSLVGAKQFLSVSMSLLERPATSLWITPEGRFADVRDHSADFMPGLAHLAHALQRRESVSTRTWFVPIAIEYTFWEERLPEILVWFGQPQLIVGGGAEVVSKTDWNARLSTALRDTQKKLAAAAIARDDSQFEVTLSGLVGTSRIYDAWRRTLSRLTGKPLEIQHGQKLRGK